MKGWKLYCNKKCFRFAKAFFRLFVLFFSGSSAYGAFPGWYNPSLVSRNVVEYGLYSDRAVIHAVTVELKERFVPGKSVAADIVLYRFSGRKIIEKEKAAEVTLPPSEFLFTLIPSVAATKDGVMIFWQEPGAGGRGTTIKYAFRSASETVFGSALALREGEFFGSLPQASADDFGGIHLFYQSYAKGGRFSIQHAVFRNGKFEGFTPVIKNIDSMGKGAFFPSVLFRSKEIYLMYQSRQTKNLMDELYLVTSKDGGRSFSAPRQITKNTHNDFAPYLVSINGRLEFVWQANPGGNWDIFRSELEEKPESEPVKVSISQANAYRPVMAYTPKNGRVVVWYDQRKIPPQIYAKFLDAGSELISKDHPATKGKSAASEPRLVVSGSEIYLFFVQGRRLYLQKSDRETSQVVISSPTHGEGNLSRSRDVRIEWKLANEPSGVDSYAFLVDQRDNSEPDLYNLDGEKSHIDLKEMNGGRYYFHLKYKDKAGNESKKFSFPFTVDPNPPTTPSVVSNTHTEALPVKETRFVVSYESQDDLALKGYRYVLSENIGASLQEFTTETTLSFDDLDPGKYYFMVQSEDSVGNLSQRSIYSFEVAPADYEDFFVQTNIENNKVLGDKLTLEINLNREDKSIQKVRVQVLNKKIDPFSVKKELSYRRQRNIYQGEIPVKLKHGFYILSLGLEYSDGSRSIPRYYFFEYGEPEEETAVTVQLGPRFRWEVEYWFRSKFEKTLPEIRMVSDGELYTVQFFIAEELRKRVAGYSYRLSNLPGMPDGKINYLDSPVYLYNLNPGTYYLSVRPVFHSRKANKKAGYSYIRFEVKGPLYFLSMRSVVSGLALFVIILLWLFRKKIIYYSGRFR